MRWFTFVATGGGGGLSLSLSLTNGRVRRQAQAQARSRLSTGECLRLASESSGRQRLCPNGFELTQVEQLDEQH